MLTIEERQKLVDSYRGSLLLVTNNPNDCYTLSQFWLKTLAENKGLIAESAQHFTAFLKDKHELVSETQQKYIESISNLGSAFSQTSNLLKDRLQHGMSYGDVTDDEATRIVSQLKRVLEALKFETESVYARTDHEIWSKEVNWEAMWERSSEKHDFTTLKPGYYMLKQHGDSSHDAGHAMAFSVHCEDVYTFFDPNVGPALFCSKETFNKFSQDSSKHYSSKQTVMRLVGDEPEARCVIS